MRFITSILIQMTVLISAPVLAHHGAVTNSALYFAIEGDELVIESSEFPPSRWGLALAAIPLGNGSDVPSSAEKRVVERYSASEDGSTLRVEYTVEDPVYLTEPYTGYRDFSRIPDDTPLHSYGCEVDSASRYSRNPEEP